VLKLCRERRKHSISSELLHGFRLLCDLFVESAEVDFVKDAVIVFIVLCLLLLVVELNIDLFDL